MKKYIIILFFESIHKSFKVEPLSKKMKNWNNNVHDEKHIFVLSFGLASYFTPVQISVLKNGTTCYMNIHTFLQFDEEGGYRGT